MIPSADIPAAMERTPDRAATTLCTTAVPRHDRPAHQAWGRLTVASSAGRSAITRLHANSPLRWLTPAPSSSTGAAAWVYASTLGGGLLPGDWIRQSITVDCDATCFLTTQSATKVYPALDDAPARQDLDATVADDALLVLAPDPIVCFRQARYQQRQCIQLAPTASLVLVDWCTSGRSARGERWAMSHYESQLQITAGERLWCDETLQLDPVDGPLAAEHRLGRFNVLATAFITGPRVRDLAGAILAHVQAYPLAHRAPLIVSASPWGAGGVVLRAAAESTQALAHLLRDHLSPLAAQLGDDPWQRKW